MKKTIKKTKPKSQLIPPNLEKIPRLRDVGYESDPVIHARYFTPFGCAVWYVAAIDKDFRQMSRFEDDHILYVYADLGDPEMAEWGDASLRELESIVLPFGQRIERDTSWTPCRFSETPHGKLKVA